MGKGIPRGGRDVGEESVKGEEGEVRVMNPLCKVCFNLRGGVMGFVLIDGMESDEGMRRSRATTCPTTVGGALAPGPLWDEVAPG